MSEDQNKSEILNYRTLHELNAAFFSHIDSSSEKGKNLMNKSAVSNGNPDPSCIVKFADQPITTDEKRMKRSKYTSRYQNKIEDGWMNSKCQNLIRKHNYSILNTNRMNMTTSSFGTKRSLMSSQYTNRKMLISQGVQKKSKNSTFMNFTSPGTKYLNEFTLTDEISNQGVLPKKTQRLKYTMDELKLSCNKTTFMKFYELKTKAKHNQKLTAIIHQIKSRMWKPQVREECTLDMIADASGKMTGYLINGFNGDGIKQIVKLDILRRPKPLLDWNTISVKNFSKMHSKFGQATCVDGHYIYISGGAEACLKSSDIGTEPESDRKVLSNQKLNISRQCTSELVRFNSKKNQIELLPKGDYIVSAKRDHCIAKYGRFIISFGGVNDLGRVLDDLDMYDTEFGSWQPLKVKHSIEGM